MEKELETDEDYFSGLLRDESIVELVRRLNTEVLSIFHIKNTKGGARYKEKRSQ